MSRFRVRFTTRRLMILIAMIAFCISFVQMRSRWILYHNEAAKWMARADKRIQSAEADFHLALRMDELRAKCSELAKKTQFMDIRARYLQTTKHIEARVKELRDDGRTAREDALNYKKLANRYRQASLRPWLSTDSEGERNSPLD